MKKLSELEKKYDGQFQIIFEAIRNMIEQRRSRSGRSDT